MIRSAQYTYPPRRIVCYTEAEWSDPDFRKTALSHARAEAIKLKGEIIIKVISGRRKTKMASIKYVDGGARVWHANR